MSLFKDITDISKRVNLARLITKKFIRGNVETYPLLASDWVFDKIDNSIFIISKTMNGCIDSISFSGYIEKYIYNESLTVIDNTLIGNYYYTSVGFVSDEDFYLAEDILEQYNIRIPKSELLENYIYLSDKGKKYIYLGSFEIETITHEEDNLNRYFGKTDFYLYDISDDCIRKVGGTRLIQEVGKNKELFEVDIWNIDLPNMQSRETHKLVYIKHMKFLDNIRFLNLNSSYYSAILRNYDITEKELLRFELSPDKKLELKQKKSIKIKNDYKTLISKDMEMDHYGNRRMLFTYANENGDIHTFSRDMF